ncbi:hypothetical protein L209DRAFT_752790 [Thermothelomyces heterothallicus CBS 203.75]
MAPLTSPAHQKEKEKAVNIQSSQHEDGPGKAARRAATSLSSRRKTQKEMDEELRKKMEGLAGDGGESGVEYEDGKPVAMKRSVKENMFRYI